VNGPLGPGGGQQISPVSQSPGELHSLAPVHVCAGTHAEPVPVSQQSPPPQSSEPSQV
jgi:hypothetical protein